MNVFQVGIAGGRSSAGRRTGTCCSCEKPCLVLELLHPRSSRTMYEVLPERGVDIVGPVLRLQPDPYWGVGIVVIIWLAALVRKVHAVPDSGPVVIVALGVDARALHITIAATIPIPIVIVPGGGSRRQKQICPCLLR